jgi:hemerythrin superfamily protein
MEVTSSTSAAAQGDLITVVTTDHRELELIMAELQLGEGTPQHRRELADHLTTELVRHAAAEEQSMYPAARKALPDGDELADDEIREHAEVEQILKDLEGVDASDAQFDRLIGAVVSEVRHHMHEEERLVLPRLRDRCSAEELQELGRMMLKAKDSAPTRPHPSSPHKPPANLILRVGLSVIDWLRDALSGRNRD